MNTHIVVTFRSADKEYIYRESDGIRIGGRQYATCVVGAIPNKNEGRVFIDSEHASRWLRGDWALEDLKSRGLEGPVLIEERDGDPSGIIVPGGVEADEFMAQNGAMRSVGKKYN